MSEPDRELLRRLAHGDMDALGALYDRHGRRVYHVLLARGLRDEEADEVLPEVFLALAERGRKLRGVDNALAYLLGIARHLAHRVRKQRPEGTPAAPEPESRDDDEAMAAMHLVRQLPLEQAEVVVLKVWHGFTFEEIGQVLAISPNTAASRYRYGIEKLRAMWDEG
ncbi:MAG: sigma-70 family RNA polymerase sigma factor [Armatimonadetes bacterium]|nr:sigma-70 family RNA polymerase sigma factor [Armatimonadota bacterium]